MLAEWGRRADAALTRGADAAHEAVHATTLYVRRIVGAVTTAASRVAKESGDLVWNYQDVAADLRRSRGGGKRLPEGEPPREDGPPKLRVVGSEE